MWKRDGQEMLGRALRPAPDEGKEVIKIGESEGVMDGEMASEAMGDELLTAQAAQDSEPGTQHFELEVERLKAELAEARTRGLDAYRRALLAENSGRIVPDLVTGSTAEEMEGSLETARKAFEAAKATALAEMAATPVPAGNPTRQGPAIEGMSPLEKIAYGLKRE